MNAERFKTLPLSILPSLALSGLPDWEIELEQIRREMRELNSLEKRAKCEMHREERRIVQQKNKEKEKEIMGWRLDQDKKGQELKKKIETERRDMEFEQNKEFVDFKKTRKKVVRNRIKSSWRIIRRRGRKW
jgi:hypothetical protein